MASGLEKELADTSSKTIPGSFGLKVLQNLSQTHRYKNLVFSPVSLELSFTLLYRCSASSTTTEMKIAFDLMRGKQQDISDAHNQLLIETTDPNMWFDSLIIIDSQTALNTTFLKTSKEFRKIQVRLMNYKKGDSVCRTVSNMLNRRWPKSSPTMAVPTCLSNFEVDEWISMATDGNIDFRAPLKDGTIIVINSMYLRAKIQSDLFDQDNRIGMFSRSKDEQFQIEYMHGCAELQLFKSRQLKADIIEIPLKNKNEFFMYVILPFTVDGLVYTEEVLYDVNLGTQLENLRPFLVDLTMPKFSINSVLRLKEVMELQGIVRLFNKQFGELPGVAIESICVDSVYQKCGIDFTGTEKIKRKDPELETESTQTKETFAVDHPFLFIIRKNDLSNERVRNIFIGKFANNS